MRFLSLLLLLFLSIFAFSQKNGTLKGALKNDKSKPVKEAVIVVEGLNTSYFSNKKGEFEIENFPALKKIRISVTHESHKNKVVEVQLNENESKFITIDLIERELAEVVVKYNSKDEERVQVSITKIDPRQTENLPSAFGDFNKVLATLPGVSSNSELSSTYSVRGGNFDENLVYVNGIPIYRPFIVSSGQQEGLSFVNAALVRDVEFSAGGWQPKYGDKLSSVLSVQYKTPSKFGGSVTASALGGGFHVEGSSKDKKFTYVSGLRYKDSRWILRNTDVGAEFKPWFIDFQNYFSYDLTNREKHPDEIKTTIGLLTSYAQNSFYIEPQTKETNFGSFSTPKRLTIAYEGSETMSYDSYQNGLKLDHKFSSNLKTNFIISSLYTLEREFFDIEGGMRLCDVSTDPSSDNLNECTFTQDIGTEYRYGRNELEAEVYNLQSNWEYALSDKSVVEWGVIASSESIVDVIDEYTFKDSASYVGHLESLRSNLNLNSNRFGVFAQHSIDIDSNKVFTYGARASYWTVNKQYTFSPRTQFSIKPKWSRDIIFKTAVGVYHQPPFYRELRNNLGQLNKNLKAQRSIHAIGGMDYNYKMWKRTFKFTSELFYKKIDNAIVYDIEDVKIRYSAHNDAQAYAYGADFRMSGEFIKGAESWFSLGLMRTREKLDNDEFLGVDSVYRNAGYVPRPTDQLVTAGVFFQDHLPGNPTWRMYLNGVYGSGLPFNIPGIIKQNGYTYTGQVYNPNTGNFDDTEILIRSIARMPSYKRVDIGISKIIAFNVDEEIETKGIRSIWIGLEVLNVLANNNVISNSWITDLYGTQYAIPNYLSRRMVNLKVIVKF